MMKFQQHGKWRFPSSTFLASFISVFVDKRNSPVSQPWEVWTLASSAMISGIVQRYATFAPKASSSKRYQNTFRGRFRTQSLPSFYNKKGKIFLYRAVFEIPLTSSTICNSERLLFSHFVFHVIFSFSSFLIVFVIYKNNWKQTSI